MAVGDSRLIHQGRIFSLYEEEKQLPDGGVFPFDIIRHPGGAAALPVDGDGNLILIRQYRAPIGRTILEIPAGRLEAGEEPADCIRRELQEEIGQRAGRVELLSAPFMAIGFCDERVSIFLAEDLTSCAASPEEDESLEPVVLSPEDAFAMLDRGEIEDGKTLIALSLYRMRLAAAKQG